MCERVSGRPRRVDHLVCGLATLVVLAARGCEPGEDCELETRSAAELCVSRQAQSFRSFRNYGKATAEDPCDRGRQKGERQRVDGTGCPCQRDRPIQECC